MPYTPILKGATTLDTLPLYDDLAITWELMGLKEIQASVESPAPLNIPVGSYIQYKGEQYTVNTVPSVSKEGEHLYKYSITFESVLYRLYDKKLRHLNNRTFQDFGNPSAFAQLVVDNINEIDSGWAVGVCDDLDPKTINFSGHTCRTALDTIAEAFGLEWDVSGKVIRFTKQVGVTTPYVFKYGQGNGLYSLSYAYQNDKNIVTRAYGYGSTKNLPETYRNGATQLMFSEGYLESNVSLYGVKEGDYENEDIYPEVAGVLSGATPWATGDGIFTVQDETLTFDLNDYKSVETPKLSFTSGELQGQEFEIISYKADTHTYTLKVFQDGNNQTLPRVGYQAAPGDTYTLFDMPLPTELVTAAEARLRASTLEWLNTNSKPQVLYSMDLDPLYARNNNIMLQPGDRVTIQDTALGINELIRVSKVQYPVNFPEQITPSTKITIEIANFVPYTLTERVISDIQDTKQDVKTTISKGNFIKRMAEYVKTLTGVDYLPPGTAIIDPSTGTITANLINADYIIARNLITNKVKITAENNNIVIEDEDGNAIIMMDDDSALETYTLEVNDNGTSQLIPVYGPGFRVGLSPNNSRGFSSMGRKGFFTNWAYKAGGNGKELIMDRDGFTVNSGKRTLSGSIIIPPFAGSLDNKKLIFENGLIVGYETATTAGTISTDDPTSLPVDNSNDTGYTPGDGGIGGVTPIPTPATLGSVAPYPISFAMDGNKMGRADYEPMFANATKITCENATGMGHINPSSKFPFDDNTTIAQISDPNNYNWDFVEVRAISAFAQAHGKSMHYAHVIWNLNNTAVGDPRTKPQKPHVEALNTPEKQEAYLNMFITKVFQTEMPGVFSGVNVTNEMVNDFNDPDTGGLNKTNNIWTQVSTLERLTYVIIKRLREIDPTIDCGPNDYNLETGNLTRTNRYIAIDDYLRGLNETVNGRQIKYDFIGFQIHTGIGLNISIAGQRFKLWSDRGIKVFISEFDTTTENPYSLTGTPPTMAVVDQQVADMTVNLAIAYETNVIPSLRYAYGFWTVAARDFLKNQGKQAPGTYTYDSLGNRTAYKGIEHFNGLFNYYGVKNAAYYALLQHYKDLA